MAGGRRITITFLGDTKQFERSANTVESKSSRMGSVMGKVGGFGKVMAGGLAVAGGAALTAGGAFVTMGVKTAAANEQAKIAFTTMLGSGKKAQAFLTQLQNFAAKTPFDFPGLQQAASSLISAGIDAKKVIPIMTTLGDVTSGMGTGAEGVQRATIALQQMNAAGRITGEDLNQLRDAGIPVFDLLSKATGKSKAEIVKLAQAGKLGKKELDQMMKALESGKGLERFSGLMDKQSASLSGMWSTFKDTMGQNAAKAMQPLIPLLKDGLGGATKFLGEWLPRVTGGFADLIKGMQSGTGPAGRIGNVLHGVADAAKAVVGWVQHELVPTIKDLSKRFVDAIGGTAGLKKMMVQLEPTIRLVKAVLAGLWNALKAAARVAIPIVVTQLKLMVTVISALSKAAIWLWNNAFAPTIRFISKGIGFLLDKIGDMLSALSHVPGFKWAKDAADKLHKVAREARNVADSINDIPSQKEVKIKLRYSNNSGIGGADQLDLRPKRKRAVGGRVSVGDVFRINETGQEFFAPSVPGRMLDAGASRRASAGGQSVIINISGALDPNGVARQVEQILSKYQRSTGRPLNFKTA